VAIPLIFISRFLKSFFKSFGIASAAFGSLAMTERKEKPRNNRGENHLAMTGVLSLRLRRPYRLRNDKCTTLGIAFSKKQDPRDDFVTLFLQFYPF
jgi:hypothetical protein